MASKGFEEARRRCVHVARDSGANLDLSGLGLSRLPPEILQCSKVQSLVLRNNALLVFPQQLCNFGALTNLELAGNPLDWLPPAIVGLRRLTRLDIGDTRIPVLPASLTRLHGLRDLIIGGRDLADIGILRDLGGLRSLAICGLYAGCYLPPLQRHPELESLQISAAGLKEVPTWVYALPKLRALVLDNNGLESIPANISKVATLEFLDISDNDLQDLPLALGTLPQLVKLELAGNGLGLFPPEIVSQGGTAVLAYLRDQYRSGTRQWVSKLLVVGEGGVGKTSLLRRLRGEEHDPRESTTHGIAIRYLEMPHPTEPSVTMELKSWDFGGQQIYHATHQFFLTNRSLFLLVWNARLGHEQGRLYYWLDTIRARAPESPVLLVATHVDERSADLPLADIRARYPQILEHYIVSNKTNNGIGELREAIRSHAAKLPLMGERWPSTWLDAANAIRAMVKKQTHVTPQKLWAAMRENGINEDRHPILAAWLHELGDILFFQDNPELEKIVLLDPHWATEAISRVLECSEVIEERGIFTRKAMNKLWSDIDLNLRDYLLRLMEQFDLSYRTEDNRDVSIVVERLSHDTPPELHVRFDKRLGSREVAMRFQIDGTLPAGIPTWFIARSHRFTTRTHFRRGALFADGPNQEHLAVVQAFPEGRSLYLTVRGPAPHSFFTLLRDGLELTLGRFPGLQVTRLIPCPGHDGLPCKHEFKYEQLQNRLDKKRFKMECPEAAGSDIDDPDVDVREMLFGLSPTTHDDVITRLDTLLEKQDEHLTHIRALTEMVQREFYRGFRAAQRHEESHCPSLFVLRPASEKSWTDKVLGQSVELHLVCEQPGEAHLTPDSGLYKTNLQAAWLGAIAPYLTKMAAVLKYAAPLIGVTTGYASEALEKMFSADLKLMEALVAKLPTIAVETDTLSLSERYGDESMERVEGATLRQLRSLLDKLDPQRKWGGLQKVRTMEGDYLWLCEKHAAKHRM